MIMFLYFTFSLTSAEKKRNPGNFPEEKLEILNEDLFETVNI